MERMVLSTSTDFLYDGKRKDGWKIITDVPVVSNPTLELAEVMKDGELSMFGENILSRAKGLGNMAGRQTAEHVLAMADQIPESWRAFYLVFPGTVATPDFSSTRHVTCLCWDGSKWRLCWDWLGRDWNRIYRLVRLVK